MGDTHFQTQYQLLVILRLLDTNGLDYITDKKEISSSLSSFKEDINLESSMLILRLLSIKTFYFYAYMQTWKTSRNLNEITS